MSCDEYITGFCALTQDSTDTVPNWCIPSVPSTKHKLVSQLKNKLLRQVMLLISSFWLMVPPVVALFQKTCVVSEQAWE